MQNHWGYVVAIVLSWSCGSNPAPVAAQDVSPIRFGARIARAYQEVETLEKSFDARTGFGAYAAVDRIWRALGLRLDYDRVSDFCLALGLAVP